MIGSRLLLVEDEQTIRRAVGYALRRDGFAVEEVGDGDAALAAGPQSYDLVILDLMLPGTPGLDVLRGLRAAGAVPIIVLTALDSEVDRVLGLELGADDYVTKPFSVAELVSRVRALLRRCELDLASPSRQVFEVGDLRIDVRRHEVSLEERAVYLTTSQFRLLALLAETPGRVVTRRAILERLWEGSHSGDDHVCDVHVSNLRHKIERDPRHPERIVTVRAEGYKLVAV